MKMNKKESFLMLYDEASLASLFENGIINR
jgi:hypothetical protein